MCFVPHPILSDLWTTRCTRCPDALDALNDFATSVMTIDDDTTIIADRKIQCLSICFGDTLDGAREILDSPKIPRWNAIRHFFMEFNDKERLKHLLQFRQVPYYMAFDRNGALIYFGNKKIEWQQLFQENEMRRDDFSLKPATEAKCTMQPIMTSPTSSMVTPNMPQNNEIVREMVIEDMDF
jgi:hypothetical protein